MYGDYWNLARLPFENSCDPLFFFRGRSHEAALLKLQYVVEQSKGVALLVGEHGTGKTCASRALEAELRNAAAAESTGASPVVRLMFPRLSAEEMLRYLVGELSGCPLDEGTSTETLVRGLEASLREQAAHGHRPAFLIDDAHLIESPEVLQWLAQIVGLCEVRGLPLAVLLLGQPELLSQVQRVPALHGRVSVRAALHPLDQAETGAYIRHRLTVAGLDGCVFAEDAWQTFHELSQGYPRRINQLCDLALLVGYADERPALSRADIEAAAEELTSVAID